MVHILSIVATIGSLICFILVLIPLFKEKGALHGILGILCGLYTFIWGWIHVTRLNIRNVMLAWSLCMLVGMGCNTILWYRLGSQMPSGQMPAALPPPRR